MFITGVVLAAGGSRRLGVPKQLLSYRGGTLLGTTLDTARHCGFDQLVLTLGGASSQVHEQIDLTGVRVVESPDPAAAGRSSIVSALPAVDRRSDGIVVMLGDQPGVTPATVWSLVAAVAGPATPVGVCRYDDGRGHPLWFARETFDDLRELSGDEGIWQLVESGEYVVTDVDATGVNPRDVNDWDDYQALVAEHEPGDLQLGAVAPVPSDGTERRPGWPASVQTGDLPQAGGAASL